MFGHGIPSPPILLGGVLGAPARRPAVLGMARPPRLPWAASLGGASALGAGGGGLGPCGPWPPVAVPIAARLGPCGPRVARVVASAFAPWARPCGPRPWASPRPPPVARSAALGGPPCGASLALGGPPVVASSLAALMARLGLLPPLRVVSVRPPAVAGGGGVALGRRTPAAIGGAGGAGRFRRICQRI